MRPPLSNDELVTDGASAGRSSVRDRVGRSWRRAVRRAARWAGIAPSRTVPDVTRLGAPTDAIYAHRDLIFEVPLRRCRYLYGGTFGPAGGEDAATSGWHPFVAVLHELAANPDLRYEDSVLARFYERFQPQSQVAFFFPRDVAADHQDAALARAPMGSGYAPLVPWQLEIEPRSDRGEHGLGPEHGHQSYGPVSSEKGRKEFERLRSTHASIRDHGYHPELAKADVAGLFVLRGADYRFVVRSGHHRMAALAALGAEKVRVGFFHRDPRAVNAEAIATWPLVREGVFDEALAVRFVDLLFDEDQSWRGRDLGLL